LNDRFMIRMAEHLADRVRADRSDLEGQIAAAVRATLQRGPSASESQRLTEFAREFGLAEACRLLFNLNEFVYVD
jgi:hypothetical protein